MAPDLSFSQYATRHHSLLTPSSSQGQSSLYGGTEPQQADDYHVRDPVTRLDFGKQSRLCRDNEQLRRQRSKTIRQTLAASNSQASLGQPRNAADLAASLVSLVLPYDVRNLQRSLLKMQDRVKAVESKTQENTEAREYADKTMRVLQDELKTVQALVHKAGPDLTGQMGTQAWMEEVHNRHAQMMEAVAQFNEERDKISKELKRQLDQVQQLHAELASQRSPTRVQASPKVDEPPAAAEGLSLAGQDVSDETTRVHPISNEKHTHQERGSVISPAQVHTRDEADISTASDSGADEGTATARNVDDETWLGHQQETVTPNRQDEAVMKEPAEVPRLLRRRVKQSPKAVEHRRTERSIISKPKAEASTSTGLSRRAAFANHTKRFSAKYESETPKTSRAHKDFVWRFIDGIEDKEMSSYVQRCLQDRLPDFISPSKGRGKPYREIVFTGRLKWKQVFDAMKTMPVPPFFS
ncbi:hypothetical protein ACRALDRAFT_1068110 [Sodiomyces alcalophilus JCM 7366]|uniref:uncharacterized protein n=1 Tax=Sodiomyces alcalophilus JCM 7366 TaxID=591952 RepID=UPI0039B6A3E2